jgi:hypothetical protein
VSDTPAPQSTVFVYAYPDGQEPLFYFHEKFVLAYPGGDRRYYRRGDYWHPLPQGGEPELRVHQGFVFDFPIAPTPRYYLREVAR